MSPTDSTGATSNASSPSTHHCEERENRSSDSLRRRIKRARSRFRRWRWRRRVRRQPEPPLNAWGYPDTGYW